MFNEYRLLKINLTTQIISNGYDFTQKKRKKKEKKIPMS